MQIKTFIVDAFTNERFKGNQAGVCLLDDDLNESLMLSVAKELGFSETAFVRKIAKEEYSIRFFSPKMEIPLCGHATLGSSKVLFDLDGHLTNIHFKTIQELDLLITKSGDQIIMQFPIYETVAAIVPEPMIKALGLQAINHCAYNKETNILLVEIEDCVELRNMKPDFEALIASHKTINGVLITASSNDSRYDFESRYFWPWSGTNEDPVTGGTHTFLAKYWSEKLGKKIMHSFQCSERSGFMEVELVDDKHLLIKSNAQLVLKGIIKL
ncbi:MAG: PhzF family phenazine biosynthesis protein [Chitinophagaceae bacterium]